MAAYVKSLDLTLMIDQPPGAEGAPQWGPDPTQFVTTANGAADGSTVVSLNLGPWTASDDTYVGMLVECVDVDATLGNDQNKNVRRMIVEHAEAAGVVTLTVEQFPAQVISGDSFRIINTLASVPYISDDTGGSAVQLQDASRNAEANDYWLGSAAQGGPYLEIVEADNIAKTQLILITDFTQVGGVFLTAALGANSAIGDFAEVLCCPEWVEQGFMDCTWEPLPREQYQGTYETPADEKGRRVSSGTGVLLFRGPGSGSGGDPTVADRILSSPLDVEAVGDLTVNDPGAGGTTISTPYDAGAALVGRLYCSEEGSCSCCTAAGTPAEWTPPLRSRAGDDTTVTGLRTYTRPSDFNLNHHIYLKQYKGDGIIERIYGCVPTLVFNGQLNDFLRISCGFVASDWERTAKDSAGAYTRAWRAKRPTVNPVRSAGGRIVVGTSTATTALELSMKSFNVDLGIEYEIEEEESAPNGLVGYRLVGVNPKGNLTGMIDSTNVDRIEEHLSGVEIQPFSIQVGSRVGFPGVWYFWAYRIQFTNLQITDEGKKKAVSLDWKVCDHDTDSTGLYPWALGMG